MPAVLYLDEHFGSGVVAQFARDGTQAGLRAEGFRGHLPRGATDVEHLYLAARRGWTIVSRDRDFLALHDHWHVLQVWRPVSPPLLHGGILLVESASTPDDDVVRHVLALLSSPRCPSLLDHLLVLVSGGRWLAHRPFADRRRRPVQL